MKTVIEPADHAYEMAAEEICSLLARKPDAAIGFPGGRTIGRLLDLLAEASLAGRISFAEASLFVLTNFADLPDYAPQQPIFILKEHLLDRLPVGPKQVIVPDPAAPEAYDRALAEIGGLDLVVLGLGDNAHIAYNEPAIPFESHTAVRRLTDATKRQNAGWFGALEKVPEKAVSIGIRDICNARRIMVLAFGTEKAKAVYKMLYGRTDSVVPAAFLQIPTDVTVLIDNEAAAELEKE